MDPKPADAYRLGRASLAEMVRPHVKVTDTLSWGLGWGIERNPEVGDIITHGGDNPGFKCITAASLRQRRAFAMVTNSDRGFDDIVRPVLRSAAMRAFLPVSV
jgi:hypothetical protein